MSRNTSGRRRTFKNTSGHRKTLKKTFKKDKFWPHKYYSGLTRKQALERKKEIDKFGKMDWRDSRAYVGFKTDRYAKTRRKSSYTAQWNRLFPEAKSLSERSKVTGVPEKYIKDVGDRGSAAWISGHRPGATEGQWKYARISSFLLCGKTHYTADSDIVRKAKKNSAKSRKWFKRCKETRLTRV